MSPVFPLILLLPFCGVLTALQYNGPYLFWGVPKLAELDSSAINGLDKDVLMDSYAEASAIMIFIKNATHPMTIEHYPGLEQLLADRKWAYMTQNFLTHDPMMDFSEQTKVIPLSGTTGQQDNQLCTLYHEAEGIFGEHKVLGILANDDESAAKLRQEIQHNSKSTKKPGAHLYKSRRAMLYTSKPPVIKYNDRQYELDRHSPLVVDKWDTHMFLSVKYVGVGEDMDVDVVSVTRN